MKTVYIYTLSDPITKEVRYVGKTRNLAQRRHNHLNSCRDKNTHKRNWINSLRKVGCLPVMQVLDEVPESEWQFWERYWIGQLKIWNTRLINHTAGGDGLTTGNQTSFKKGNVSWNKGTAKPKIKKGFNPICLNTAFKKGQPGLRKGIKGKNKPDKNVFQYSALTGQFIQKWDTAKKASIALTINEEGIGQCARGKAKTAGGYIWSYEHIEIINPVIYTGICKNKFTQKLK